MGMGWMVAAARAATELEIAGDVRSLGLSPYVPRYQVRSSVRGRVQRRTELLLPGYVIVRWTRRWMEILAIRGVVKILGVSALGRPGRVPHEQVKNIRDMENEHGFVVLPDVPETQI